MHEKIVLLHFFRVYQIIVFNKKTIIKRQGKNGQGILWDQSYVQGDANLLFRSEKRTNASYIIYTIVAHEELVRGLHAPYVKNEIIYVYIPFIKNKMSRSVFWRIDRSGF